MTKLLALLSNGNVEHSDILIQLFLGLCLILKNNITQCDINNIDDIQAEKWPLNGVISFWLLNMPCPTTYNYLLILKPHCYPTTCHCLLIIIWPELLGSHQCSYSVSSSYTTRDRSSIVEHFHNLLSFAKFENQDLAQFLLTMIVL
jgi:hypothetical protein